jgi:hypothetical protein
MRAEPVRNPLPHLGLHAGAGGATRPPVHLTRPLYISPSNTHNRTVLSETEPTVTKIIAFINFIRCLRD